MQSRTTSDGTRYDVHDGPGPAVVLIHGLGLNRQMWQWQAAALGRHFTLIAYDLAGHGESAPAAQTPSLTVFAGQLRRLLDELSVAQAAIAGFSLGGMIARRFAMDHPARLWALAVLHSAHARDAAAHDAVQARVRQAREDGPGATLEGALNRWFSDNFRLANPAIMQQVRDWVMANDRDIYPANYQVLVDGVAELIAPVPPIDCPALVMTGEHDYGNSAAMTHAIAAEMPGSRTVILPGLRHMSMVENPQLFNTGLLAFLHAAAKAGGHAG